MNRLGKMVKTLLDMSELQTVARDEKIALDALVRGGAGRSGTSCRRQRISS